MQACLFFTRAARFLLAQRGAPSSAPPLNCHQFSKFVAIISSLLSSHPALRPPQTLRTALLTLLSKFRTLRIGNFTFRKFIHDVYHPAIHVDVCFLMNVCMPCRYSTLELFHVHALDNEYIFQVATSIIVLDFNFGIV